MPVLDTVRLLSPCISRLCWALPPLLIPLQRTQDCKTNCCQNSGLKRLGDCCGACRQHRERAPELNTIEMGQSQGLGLGIDTTLYIAALSSPPPRGTAQTRSGLQTLQTFFIVEREGRGQKKLAAGSIVQLVLLAAARVPLMSSSADIQ